MKQLTDKLSLLPASLAVAVACAFLLSLLGPMQNANAQTVGSVYSMGEAIRAYQDAKAQQEIYLDPRSNLLSVNYSEICDAVRLPNKRIVYLNRSYGPTNWDYAEKEMDYLSYVGNQSNSRHQRIFTIDGDEENVYVISSRGYTRDNRGHSIFRHDINDKGGQIVASFRERITRPKYVISNNSEAYIYGRSGLIYRWSKADGMTRWEIDKPADIIETRRNMFARMHALKMGDAVCFFNQVDAKYPKKELRDLLVFTGPTPTTISLQGKSTGPAAVLNESTIRFLRNDSFMDVDIQTGEITESSFKRPLVDKHDLIATKLFHMPDGKMYSLWRKPFRSVRKHDIPGFSDGCYNQFAVWLEAPESNESSGSWEMLGQGRDRVLYGTDQVATDDDGNVWMTTGHGALMCLTAKGQIHEIGFGSSFGFGSTSLLKFDDGKLLIADANSENLAFEDPRALLKDVGQTSGHWTVYYSRIPLEWDKRNQMVLFSINPQEGLMEFQAGGVKSIPLPPDEQLDLSQPIAVTRDSNHEFWIFMDGEAGSEKDRTFWRSDGEWKTFQPRKLNDGRMLPSKEVAFQSRLDDGVNQEYVIGRRFNKYRVSFGPDRKIVFRNEGKRVSYFNGKQWAWSRVGEESDSFTLDQQPFFLNGVTTIYNSEASHSLSDELWDQHRGTEDPRPWEAGNAVTYPFKGEQYFNLTTNYPDGPFSEDEANWGYRACNILYSIVRAHDKLGMHYPGGLWNVIPANGTPVETDNSWDELWIGTHNRWFLQYPESNGVRKYIVYEPAPIKIEPTRLEIAKQAGVESADESADEKNGGKEVSHSPGRSFGTFDEPFAKVKPKWKSDPPLTQVQFRYRFDETDEWSQWVKKDTEIQVPGFAKPGQYQMYVQLGSLPRPLPNRTLVYPFTVKYELAGYVTPLIEQLQSDEYKTRRQATVKLLELGPAALPHLEPLLKHRDAEVRMTAEMVSKLLKQSSESEDNEGETTD